MPDHKLYLLTFAFETFPASNSQRIKISPRFKSLSTFAVDHIWLSCPPEPIYRNSPDVQHITLKKIAILYVKPENIKCIYRPMNIAILMIAKPVHASFIGDLLEQKLSASLDIFARKILGHPQEYVTSITSTTLHKDECREPKCKDRQSH